MSQHRDIRRPTTHTPLNRAQPAPGHFVREGPVAPWRQVFDLYRQRIESGELPPGTRLPSIRGMSQEFGIAGTTAQKVIGALKTGGLVVTSPMGTFVTER